MRLQSYWGKTSSVPTKMGRKYIGRLRTVNDLHRTSVVPVQVERFLTSLLSGDTDPSKGTRTCRPFNSIGQDICRAVANWEWELPNHVVIGMARRHMFRSAELIAMLNRLGHCENYSFLWELKTNLAVAVFNELSLLPPGVVLNPSCVSLFHSDFDNFDVFINELFGTGSVHRAQSLRMLAEPNLQECYIGKRNYPQYLIAKNRWRWGSTS